MIGQVPPDGNPAGRLPIYDQASVKCCSAASSTIGARVRSRASRVVRYRVAKAASSTGLGSGIVRSIPHSRKSCWIVLSAGPSEFWGIARHRSMPTKPQQVFGVRTRPADRAVGAMRRPVLLYPRVAARPGSPPFRGAQICRVLEDVLHAFNHRGDGQKDER